MDFENFNQLPEEEKKTNTETVAQATPTFTDLPKLEDLLKSENEVTPIVTPKIEGLKQVDVGGQTVEKTFQRKADEKKSFVKRRLKIITGVYACVCALLFGFVVANTATLSNLGKTSATNTQQIQSGSTYMQGKEEAVDEALKNKIEVSVNTPRDYGSDETELTFFDKMTILFRSLFG